MSKSGSERVAPDVEQSVAHAVRSFADGDPVLVHDAVDREGEVDLIYPAGAVTPSAVARLRADAGGLICVAMSDAVCGAFGLPLVAKTIDHPAVEGGPDYDDRSSFSVTVNHRDTYTGVTDRDRSRTITALADAAADPAGTTFAAEFRIPGHVHILRGAAEGLADRRGHTELGLALAEAANLPPAVVVAEMLDGASGGALSVADARRYAEQEGFVFVEGAAVVAALG